MIEEHFKCKIKEILTKMIWILLLFIDTFIRFYIIKWLALHCELTGSTIDEFELSIS